MKLKKEDLSAVKIQQIGEFTFCTIIQLQYYKVLNLVFEHILYAVESPNVERYIHDEIRGDVYYEKL